MIEKILLIDDDEITLLICEMVIEKEGFAREVIKLRNGQEGMDFFQQLAREEKHKRDEQIPELILLDLNMPLMNGWEFMDEFANKFKDDFPNVKICILTSSVDPMDITYCRMHDNVIGFINKPLTAERLNELKENEELVDFFTN